MRNISRIRMIRGKKENYKILPLGTVHSPLGQNIFIWSALQSVSQHSSQRLPLLLQSIPYTLGLQLFEIIRPKLMFQVWIYWPACIIVIPISQQCPLVGTSGKPKYCTTKCPFTLMYLRLKSKTSKDNNYFWNFWSTPCNQNIGPMNLFSLV